MRPSNRWTLHRRFSTGLVVLLVVAAGASATAIYNSAHSLRLLHQQQSSVMPASADASAFVAAMVDQETGVRGYVLTGDAQYLQPYDAGRSRARSLDAKLGAELKGQAADLGRLHATEAAYQRWLTQSAQPTIALVGSGRRSVAASAANVAQGKTLFDDVRGQLGGLTSALGAESAAAADQLTHQQHQEVYLAVIRSLVIVGLVVLVVWVVRLWLLRPIETTAAQVRKVAGGGHRPPDRAERTARAVGAGRRRRVNAAPAA